MRADYPTGRARATLRKAYTAAACLADGNYESPVLHLANIGNPSAPLGCAHRLGGIVVVTTVAWCRLRMTPARVVVRDERLGELRLSSSRHWRLEGK